MIRVLKSLLMCLGLFPLKRSDGVMIYDVAAPAAPQVVTHEPSFAGDIAQKVRCISMQLTVPSVLLRAFFINL